jgi:excinuclease ABC subunit C
VPQLFASRPFSDFGPNYLFPLEPPAPIQHVAGPRPGALRGQVRELCSRKPGVYGMLDRHGELIYIGKAKCLRARLLSYFRPRSRDVRAGRIVSHTAALAWEVCGSEFGALLRELELIRRWRPRFNVHGQPDHRRPTYVCVGRAPAPYVFLAQRPPRGVLAWYGPVVNGQRARAAVRRLNDGFLLRDCPQAQEMAFADHRSLFPLELSPGCLRHEIGTCLGPCAALCSRTDYFAQVRAVCAFLEGKDAGLLLRLEQDMAAAALTQQYERAALLRDHLGALGWLYQHLEQMRQLRATGSFVYPVRKWDGDSVWYLIHAGQTVAALPAPRDDTGRRRAAQLLHAVYHTGEPRRGEGLAQRDSILLVASWFRRYPKEQQRLLRPDTVLGELGPNEP